MLVGPGRGGGVQCFRFNHSVHQRFVHGNK